MPWEVKSVPQTLPQSAIFLLKEFKKTQTNSGSFLLLEGSTSTELPCWESRSIAGFGKKGAISSDIQNMCTSLD